MSRRQRSPVPKDLIKRIDVALKTLDVARAQLAASLFAVLSERRQARHQVEAAFEVADTLLREATRLTRSASFLTWRQWRGRLSQLDAQHQQYLFAEMDDFGVLGLGEIQAIDTGMSGPAIGDLQHGITRPAGSAPHYGLDLAATLSVLPYRGISGSDAA